MPLKYVSLYRNRLKKYDILKNIWRITNLFVPLQSPGRRIEGAGYKQHYRAAVTCKRFSAGWRRAGCIITEMRTRCATRATANCLAVLFDAAVILVAA